MKSDSRWVFAGYMRVDKAFDVRCQNNCNQPIVRVFLVYCESEDRYMHVGINCCKKLEGADGKVLNLAACRKDAEMSARKAQAAYGRAFKRWEQAIHNHETIVQAMRYTLCDMEPPAYECVASAYLGQRFAIRVKNIGRGRFWYCASHGKAYVGETLGTGKSEDFFSALEQAFRLVTERLEKALPPCPEPPPPPEDPVDFLARGKHPAALMAKALRERFKL